VRSAILLALEVEARNVAKDFEPRGRVTPNLDLRLDGSKRVERLLEQIAHDACLGFVAGRANIVDRQVIVNPQVALDKAGDLPIVVGAVEALEDENVAAAGSAAVTLAATLMVRMREGAADSIT
jgi:hypothetical protein